MKTPFKPNDLNSDRSLGETVERYQHGIIMADNDAELIRRARRGDPAAYGVLYQRHVDAASRLAGQLTGSRADADDVVAETFARVLNAMRNGNGPDEAFRPYLLTALRRAVIDQVRGQHRLIPTEESQLPDPGETFPDPVIAELDRSLIAQAFRSLPERWSAVLWHTEVEQATPAEVARLLGISANSVAALRYRAREGLRQAYLQLHVRGRAATGCEPIAGKLGGYVRGKLTRRQARELEAHLRRCADCTAACADLVAINAGLRGVLAPAILGAAAAGYLASAVPTAASVTGSAAGAVRSVLVSVRQAAVRAANLLAHRPAAGITAAAAAASLVIPVLTLVHPPHKHLVTAPPLRIARLRETTPGPGSPRSHRATGSRNLASAPRPAPSKIPSPAPSRTGRPPSSSPTPDPTSSGTPTSSPSASRSPGPSGSPTPKVTVNATAKLKVQVALNGVLGLGLTVMVTVDVSDQGDAGTGPLTAKVTLPAGVALLSLGTSSWSCGTGTPMTCTHQAIAAGADANLSFSVLVVSLSGCGDSLVATVASGKLAATGRSGRRVACPLL
jgi:RNA polymerase sigma factor (sigma-70 family)